MPFSTFDAFCKMDILKIIQDLEKQIQLQREIIKQLSNDIKMNYSSLKEQNLLLEKQIKQMSNSPENKSTFSQFIPF